MVFSEKHLGKKIASQKSWRVSSTEMLPTQSIAQRHAREDDSTEEVS